ncbi:MAG: gephyrin-like molybdotransferase Glp [Microthrixaceae bacterium]
MISRADALRHVLERVAPLSPVEVEVASAAGLVLAEDVTASRPVPPFANTAMDGIAVHAADTHHGAVLRLVGTVAAGDSGAIEVGRGQAVRIMTGAPVPPGADAVVMVELCTFEGSGADETVTVASDVPVGNHIRPVGDDIAAGSVVLSAGSLISPGAIALLRTVGRGTVRAHPRPRVGVMSTGDELVEPPAELGPGQIYDSNRAALVALVAGSGFEPVDLGLIPDDERAIERALRDGAARCDAVLSSGGVSMGDFDFVKTVLDRVGDMAWMQIAIKPAKPFAFGTIDTGGRSVPVFGLPGNPVSSMVSFELFARPGLRRMAGHTSVDRPTMTVLAGEDFTRRTDGKTHFARVVVSAGEGDRYVARSAGGQGSHHLAAMAHANGLAVIEDGDGVAAGDLVDVLLVEPLA